MKVVSVRTVHKKSLIFFILCLLLFYNSYWLLQSRKQTILVLIVYLRLQVQQIVDYLIPTHTPYA